MKKNLPLYILLIFLIVVNAFFLYNYLGNGSEKPKEFGKNEQPKKGMNRSEHFLVNELKLDDIQKEKYRALTKANRISMREVQGDIRELKNALFNGLSEASFENSAIDSIAGLIGEKEKEKDILTFRHFKEVQKLCNKQQKEKFSKIINHAIRIEGKPRGGRPDGNRPNRPDGPRGNRPPPPER